MSKIIGRITASAALLSASAAPLYAQSYSWWSWLTGGHGGGHSGGGSSTPRAVPEIDATSGVLAVAAVIAILAFVWERRRRAQ